MMRLTFRISLLLFAVVAAIPFVAVLHPEVAGYWLREMVYLHVAERIEKVANTPNDRVEATCGFFFLNEVDPFPPFPVIDHTVYTDLVRGMGMCDQRVNGMLTVLDRLNVSGQFLITKQHTVGLIELNGTQIPVDPTYNVMWMQATADDGNAFQWNAQYWKAIGFDGIEISDYPYADIWVNGAWRLVSNLQVTKVGWKMLLDRLIGVYYRVFNKLLAYPLINWIEVIHDAEDQAMCNPSLFSDGLESDPTFYAGRLQQLLELSETEACLPHPWKINDAPAQDCLEKRLFLKRMEHIEKLSDRQKQLFGER